MEALPTVAIIGDTMVDIQVAGLQALPAWGADRDCRSVTMLPGGSAANVARQLGSIGIGRVRVALFSTVGSDESGRFFLRALEEENVVATPRETLVVLDDTPQSTCVILSGPEDRAMVTCYTSIHKIELSIFEGHPSLERAAIVHIGSYFNLKGLHTTELIAFVRTCRARGALITLDPQYDCDEAWSGVDGHLRRLLPLVDVFLPNEVEACGVTGKATPEEALETLAAEYPAMLTILSVGADGALAARGSERWRVGALEARFVDATGAGDAFDAGCLLSLLRDRADVEGAIRSGVAAGAAAVSVLGACEHPIRREHHEAILRDGCAK